jgi:hypothetical protein
MGGIDFTGCCLANGWFSKASACVTSPISVGDYGFNVLVGIFGADISNSSFRSNTCCQCFLSAFTFKLILGKALLTATSFIEILN